MRHSGVGMSWWSTSRHKCNGVVIIVRFSNLPRSRPYKLDLPGAGCLYQSEKVTGFVTMTVGSNSPSGVRKAAFHSSPSLMWILLYPHRTSTFVKRVHPRNLSMTWGIRGETFRFFMVHLLIGR